MGRLLWEEVIPDDFYPKTGIKFVTYRKDQYWSIKNCNAEIAEDQSTFNQLMDSLVTGLTVVTTGLELAPSLAKAGLSVMDSSARAVFKTKNLINRYRLNLFKKSPGESIKMKTFAERQNYLSKLQKGSSEYQKEFRRPLISEQEIVRTQTQDIRVTRKKKIVIRVRDKGLKGDPVPHYKNV